MSIRFDRLSQIAEDVRRIPPAQFDMSKWCNDCQTVGCAIGWHIMLHPECGLKLVHVPDNIMVNFFPSFDDKPPHSAYSVIADYLGISKGSVMDIFSPLNGGKNTPEAVANLIDQFIRDHRESPVIEMKPSAVAPVAARQLEGESV